MSLTLDATATARIAAGVRGVCWLVTLDFASGLLRYTNFPLSLTVGGYSYTGLGHLVEIGTIAESENTAAEQVTLTFTVVNQAMLAASLGNVEDYRGRAANIYLQLLDDTFQPAGAPVLRWSGRMQPVRVVRQAADPAGGPSTGRIELPCARAGMDRARNATGLRLTHAQQIQRFPGDLGLEYVQTLLEQPALWISKRFQELP